MTDEQKKNCHLIIHTASTAAAGVGAGLAQLPLSDNLLLVPIQVTMIVSLGVVFDIHITEAVAKAAALTGLATVVGRGVSQVLFGWIPVFGNAWNATTAAAITEAMGWGMAESFAKGEIPGK